jgi:hypothetical protein
LVQRLFSMIQIHQIKDAQSPALLFSGGKDSLLLLDVAREIRPDITVIHFYDRLHPQVERIFKLWDLNLLSWRPAHQYFIPWQDDPALVSEYSFGDARLPVVTGITQGDECEVERLSCQRMTHFDYPFDLTLWGYKHGDERHPVMGEAFPIAFDLGPTMMLAPLYHWSDDDVLSEIERRGIPYEPFSDELRMCERCQQSIGSWDKETSLQFFANRFNFREAA